MKRFALALAALAILCLTGTAHAAGPLDKFVFIDARQPSAEAPLVVKPWTDQERATVKGMLETIQKSSPGLIQRAIAYRPVRVYRTERLGLDETIAGVIRPDHAIIVTDRFFKAPATPGAISIQDPYFMLVRDVAHLADAANKASATKEWVDLVKPMIDKVRAAAAQKQERLGDLVAKGNDAPAREAGLPTAFAAYSPSEALAEFAAALVVKKDYAMPAPVKAYVEKRVLSASFTADESSRRFHEALSAFENAKIDDALKLYDQAIKLDPNFREAYLNRGLIYKYKGEWDKAIADFDQGVKLSYGEVASEIYFERGFAQIQKKNFDAAIADFTSAIARAPTRTAQDVVQSYALRAEGYMNKREYAKAASDLNFVIELNPQSSYAYLTRGRAKYEQQDAVGAIADYTKAISINPKDPRPYFMRGFAYGSLKQYKEAKVDLEEAIRIDPEIAPLAKPPLDFVNGEIAKGK